MNNMESKTITLEEAIKKRNEILEIIDQGPININDDLYGLLDYYDNLIFLMNIKTEY